MSSNSTAAVDAKFEFLLLSSPAPGVLLIQLNRPKALNALQTSVFVELNKALTNADKDSTIGACIITGNERAFAGEYDRE